jgi:glycosyltransferase-like protein LARGE
LQELTEAWKDGTIMYFYQYISARGQAPTNHTRYFEQTSPNATPNPDLTSTYLVDEWKLGYEPYLIFRKDGPPWCDERFIGFGHNKEACAGEMLLSGMRFHVLREHFIVHRKHEKDGADNKRNEVSFYLWLAGMGENERKNG